MREIVKKIIVEGEEYFNYIRKEYPFYLKSSFQIDIEPVTEELINNFLFGEALFLLEDYLCMIKKLTFEDLLNWLKMSIL